MVRSCTSLSLSFLILSPGSWWRRRRLLSFTPVQVRQCEPKLPAVLQQLSHSRPDKRCHARLVGGVADALLTTDTELKKETCALRLSFPRAVC